MMKKKIIAAGGIVENEKGEILMMSRRGFWDLPKGKLDEGESIEACAVREVQEETGLQNVELISFLCKTQHEYFDKWINEDVAKETWWYLMKSSSLEKLIPQTEEDIEQLIWVNKKEMDKYLVNTYPSIKEVLFLRQNNF
jgi:mutator protein MutT